MKLPIPLCGLLLAALAAGRAHPDDDEFRAVTVESTRRAAAISTDNDWVVQNPGESGGSRSASGLYRETLDLGFAGSVYHPNLLSYSLDALLGLSQRDGAGAEPQSLRHSFIANLHLRTYWLREKPLSFSLYADRSDDFRDISSFEEARLRETVLGGLLNWTNEAAPLTFSVEKRIGEEQRDTLGFFEDRLLLSGGVTRTSADERRVSRLGYAYSDFDRRSGGEFRQEGRSHDARFSNELLFGRSEANRLSSSLAYLNLRGTEDTDTLDLAESLELGLPLRLTGRAHYHLHLTDSGSSRALVQQGQLELRHQLYESLTTGVSLRGGLTGAEGYREGGIGPGLELLYRKKISFGVLNLSYNLNADWRNRRADERTVRILDERHTLSDGTVTFLDDPGADPATLLVTDASGITVYAPGIDYTVTLVAGRVRLSRVATGGIPNGAEVLVDYAATSDSSFGYLQLGQAAGLHLDLFEEKLALYYRIRSQRYPAAEGLDKALLERATDHTLGAALSLQPLACAAEYELYGSSLSPYQALRFQESLNLPIADRSLLTVQGSQNLILFADSGERQGYLDLVARCDYSPLDSMVLYAGGGWQLQAGTEAARQSTWLARAGLDFRRGLLAFSVGYEFKGSSSPAAGQHHHSLAVNLKREF